MSVEETEEGSSAPLGAILSVPGAGKTKLAVTALREFGGALVRTEDGDQAFAGKDYRRTKVAPVPTEDDPDCFINWFSEVITWASENLVSGDTLFIDSLTATGIRIEQTVLANNPGAKDLISAGGGYGKGYAECRALFTSICDELDWLRETCDIAVIWLGHIQAGVVKNNPEADGVLAFSMAIDRRMAEVLSQRAQFITAVQVEVISVGKEENSKGVVTRPGRIVKSGRRWFVTDASSSAHALLCKTRFEFPTRFEYVDGDLTYFDYIPFYTE